MAIPDAGQLDQASVTASIDSTSNEPVYNKSTGRAVHTESQAGSIWAYGDWPQTQYNSGTATVSASATDNVEIYEITDARMFNYHVFENFASTDPVDVYVSVDGITYAAAAVRTQIQDSISDALPEIDIAVAKVGVVEGKFYKIKVLRKGTTNEAQNIRYSHSVK